MSRGLHKGEQWALFGLIALIAIAAGVQSRRAGESLSAAGSGASGDWERLAVYRADGEIEKAGGTGAQIASPTDPAARKSSPAAIDINTASAVELDRLDRIGPVRAEAIVEYRRAHGPFTSIDRLTDVPGIGPATLDRVRPYIMVSGSPGPAGAPGDRTRSEPPSPAQAGSLTAGPPAKPLRIDPNTATALELEALPEIGPVLAGRIVIYRTRARFRRPEDLTQVQGIGPKTLETIRPYLIIR